MKKAVFWYWKGGSNDLAENIGEFPSKKAADNLHMKITYFLDLGEGHMYFGYGKVPSGIKGMDISATAIILLLLSIIY